MGVPAKKGLVPDLNEKPLAKLMPPEAIGGVSF
jgi:hypothetical protein